MVCAGYVGPDLSKPCEWCGQEFRLRDKPGIAPKRFLGAVKYCSKVCSHRAQAGDRDARFWASVQKGAGEGCWEWQGSRDPGGYGVLWYRGSYIRAHRLALELDGRPLKPGEFALHSCDNRICVNPGHLRGGTHADNARDRVMRQRGKHHIGQDNHSAKLTDEAVRFIRGSSEATRKLAAIFGVREPCIRNVRKGRTWSHVE